MSAIRTPDPFRKAVCHGVLSIKVSVVIPTYNRAYIFREVLESALAQRYRNFEIVIVGDGSTDNTPDMAVQCTTERVRYITGVASLIVVGMLVGKGAANARIMGIVLSRFITGTFIVRPVFLYILMRFSGVTARSLFAAIAPVPTSAASVLAVDGFFSSLG
jgi:cellulose synthase/poly-beta-1,6-N-acetylglucosamine synthase-like glycosyltransferase